MTASTFSTSGSRAGIGSPIVADSGSGDTYMVSGLGAENDPTLAVNTSVTGVAATSGIGTPTVQGDGTITLTGVASTSGIGTPTIELDESLTLTGVSSSSAVGTPTVQGNASLTLTGVSSTSGIGTPTVQGDASFTLTGVAGTSAVGTPVAEVDHAVTGVAGTFAVGTTSVTISDNLSLTGVAATGGVGTPIINIDDAALVGQAATTAVGSVAAEIDVGVTGVAATSAVGDPTRAIPLIGVVATPLVGLLLGTAVPIVGVEADIAIGSLSVDVIDGAIITGVSSTVTLGTLALQEDNNPSVIGVQTTLGTNLLPSAVEPVTTGVEATGEVGEPIPTNLQLPGTAILVQLGTIGVSADNAVLVGLQSLAQVGVPLAISTGNHSSVAITGVAATPTVGIPIPQDGIAISGVETDSAIGDVAVATSVSSGLVMTDIQIEAILDLRDDFSVTLRWSDTDGYSWSDSAIRSIGQTGNYLCNPQWRRLGMSRRGRVYELSWSCPQATALQGATVMYADAST